jgi:hypothetical protein
MSAWPRRPALLLVEGLSLLPHTAHIDISFRFGLACDRPYFLVDHGFEL